MLRRNRRFEGVTAAVGMPGSGKTYYLAQRAWRARLEGVPVYSNAGFDIEWAPRDGLQTRAHTLESFGDFARVEGPALVVWDELPLYFSARNWSSFPDGMLYKFTQIRKDGVRMAYSTIHEMMVDSVLRRITFWWWECHAITRRTLVRRLYPPSEFRKEGSRKGFRTEFVRVNLKVAGTYDTMGKVMVPEANAAKFADLDTRRFARPSWDAVAGDGGGGSGGRRVPLGAGDAASSEPALDPFDGTEE